MTKKNPGFNFESSLNELEKLVDALENGDLSLEQSLQDFERGINLTRACQSALSDAQQKVQILLAKDHKSSLEDYPDSDTKSSKGTTLRDSSLRDKA